LSFPLGGNPSDSPSVKGDKGGCFEKRFWPSQNDNIEDLKYLLISLRINSKIQNFDLWFFMSDFQNACPMLKCSSPLLSSFSLCSLNP
jgi:hypothetical protein